MKAGSQPNLNFLIFFTVGCYSDIYPSRIYLKDVSSVFFVDKC